MKEGYRHEYKYLISRSAAELLRRRLPCIMERDSHAGPSGQYTIRSLYFDDFANKALDEKLSGIAHRTKYRIRYYNYTPDVLKLERKEKHGNLPRKTAQTISLEDARTLQQATDVPVSGDLAKELQQRCRWEGFRPKVLVDYDRTPFVCRDGNTRITLDENLRTRCCDAELFASPRAMIPVLAPDQVILEVKFDDYLPGYLAEALGDIPKAPLAISKFALCLSIL